MRRTYSTTEFYVAMSAMTLGFASAIIAGLDAGQITACVSPVIALIGSVGFKKGMRGE